MGVGLFKSCSSSPYAAPNSNPDPGNYKIINWETCGNYFLLLINYPDAKNFEGNKILLYKDIANPGELLIRTNNKIDPHFSKDAISPIARFEPNSRGWNNAKTFIKFLSQQEE